MIYHTAQLFSLPLLTHRSSMRTAGTTTRTTSPCQKVKATVRCRGTGSLLTRATASLTRSSQCPMTRGRLYVDPPPPPTNTRTQYGPAPTCNSQVVRHNIVDSARTPFPLCVDYHTVLFTHMLVCAHHSQSADDEGCDTNEGSYASAIRNVVLSPGTYTVRIEGYVFPLPFLKHGSKKPATTMHVILAPFAPTLCALHFTDRILSFQQCVNSDVCKRALCCMDTLKPTEYSVFSPFKLTLTHQTRSWDSHVCPDNFICAIPDTTTRTMGSVPLASMTCLSTAVLSNWLL